MMQQAQQQPPPVQFDFSAGLDMPEADVMRTRSSLAAMSSSPNRHSLSVGAKSSHNSNSRQTMVVANLRRAPSSSIASVGARSNLTSAMETAANSSEMVGGAGGVACYAGPLANMLDAVDKVTTATSTAKLESPLEEFPEEGNSPTRKSPNRNGRRSKNKKRQQKRKSSFSASSPASSDTSSSGWHSGETMSVQRRLPPPGTAVDRGVIHVVRITVLGLAGITVSHPPHKAPRLVPTPNQMKCVIAFARDAQVEGTTRLSNELLLCNPGMKGANDAEDNCNDDGDDDDEEALWTPPSSPERQTQSPEESPTNSNSEPKAQKKKKKKSMLGRLLAARKGKDKEMVELMPAREPDRYIALWGHDEDWGVEGSVVEFETTLRVAEAPTSPPRRRRGKQHLLEDESLSSNTTSKYAPKSFEVIVGLASETFGAHGTASVALPFGVASLPVTGEECGGGDGEPVKMDLPILSLSQARPSMGDSGMSIVEEEEEEADDEGEDDEGLDDEEFGEDGDGNPQGGTNNMMKRLTKKKKKMKRGWGCIFGLNKTKVKKTNPADTTLPDISVIPRLPTSRERAEFDSRYRIDGSGGGAALRILVESYEKGSDMERAATARHRRNMAGLLQEEEEQQLATAAPGPENMTMSSDEVPAVPESKEAGAVRQKTEGLTGQNEEEKDEEQAPAVVEEEKEEMGIEPMDVAKEAAKEARERNLLLGMEKLVVAAATGVGNGESYRYAGRRRDEFSKTSSSSPRSIAPDKALMDDDEDDDEEDDEGKLQDLGSFVTDEEDYTTDYTFGDLTGDSKTRDGGGGEGRGDDGRESSHTKDKRRAQQKKMRDGKNGRRRRRADDKSVNTNIALNMCGQPIALPVSSRRGAEQQPKLLQARVCVGQKRGSAGDEEDYDDESRQTQSMAGIIDGFMDAGCKGVSRSRRGGRDSIISDEDEFDDDFEQFEEDDDYVGDYARQVRKTLAQRMRLSSDKKGGSGETEASSDSPRGVTDLRQFEEPIDPKELQKKAALAQAAEEEAAPPPQQQPAEEDEDAPNRSERVVPQANLVVPQKTSPSVMQALANMLACRGETTPNKNGRQGQGGFHSPLADEAYLIPQVVVRNQSAVSLGELTETTLEVETKKLAVEKLKAAVEKQAKAKESAERRVRLAEMLQERKRVEAAHKKMTGRMPMPIPVAFGGDGFCTAAPLATVDTDLLQELRATSPASDDDTKTGSGIPRVRPEDENYFADYDLYSQLSPGLAAALKEPAAEAAVKYDTALSTAAAARAPNPPPAVDEDEEGDAASQAPSSLFGAEIAALEADIAAAEAQNEAIEAAEEEMEQELQLIIAMEREEEEAVQNSDDKYARGGVLVMDDAFSPPTVDAEGTVADNHSEIGDRYAVMAGGGTFGNWQR